jgi:hypothetical protein
MPLGDCATGENLPFRNPARVEHARQFFVSDRIDADLTLLSSTFLILPFVIALPGNRQVTKVDDSVLPSLFGNALPSDC